MCDARIALEFGSVASDRCLWQRFLCDMSGLSPVVAMHQSVSRVGGAGANAFGVVLGVLVDGVDGALVGVVE